MLKRNFLRNTPNFLRSVHIRYPVTEIAPPKPSFLTPVQGQRGTHLAGDTWPLLVVIFGMCTKGQLLRRLNSSFYYLKDLKISGDGSMIFGLSIGHIQAVSIQTGGVASCVTLGDEGGGHSFFVCGSKGRQPTRKGSKSIRLPRVPRLASFGSCRLAHRSSGQTSDNGCGSGNYVHREFVAQPLSRIAGRTV